MVRVVSLFCGCGGSDLGLQQLGTEVIWANDKWRSACDTYHANMPQTEVVCGDIQKIETFPLADLLVGCYPCQGFSQGGNREADVVMNLMFIEYFRALKQVQPYAFIVENVAGMTHSQNREFFNAQIEFADSLGYDAQWRCLDARDYGLPQQRRRVFIVGVYKNCGINYTFPEPTHGPGTSRQWVTQQMALQGFPDWPDGGYFDQKFSWYYMSRRRRRDWHECAPCVVGNPRAVALHPASPIMEFVEKDKWRFVHDGPARRYSYLECAALQGFPCDFKWPIASMSANYKIIGNAVPPPLMAAVARPLVQSL